MSALRNIDGGHPRATDRPFRRRISLSAHWGQPTGLIGRFAGWEMSRGKLAVSDLVADLLELDEDSHVLEVGSGPGVTLAHLSERFPRSRFAGADRSDVMLCQAIRRNRAPCLAGRCELHLAPAERLPFADARFTAAFTLNSIGFWTSQRDGLRELARVILPGGKLLIGLRGTAHDPTSADSARSRLEQLTPTLLAAGFAPPAISEHRPGHRTITTALAQRVSGSARAGSSSS